jgi:hypothetical protein
MLGQINTLVSFTYPPRTSSHKEAVTSLGLTVESGANGLGSSGPVKDVYEPGLAASLTTLGK